MIAALRTEGLGHRYGTRTWGLREATLEVPPGRIVALVGPNGAGKTTLLHMAAGLLPPTTGTVEVIGDSPAKRLDRVGFVAQDAPLWPRLRVEDVLEIGRCMNPRFDVALADGRIDHLDIPTAGAHRDPVRRPARPGRAHPGPGQASGAAPAG